MYNYGRVEWLRSSVAHKKSDLYRVPYLIALHLVPVTWYGTKYKYTPSQVPMMCTVYRHFNINNTYIMFVTVTVMLMSPWSQEVSV